MLDLESAIKHCEEVAEELEKRVKPYQCESINKKLYEVNKKEWDDCLESENLESRAEQGLIEYEDFTDSVVADEDTHILYIYRSIGNNGYLTPYYSKNGKLCKYEDGKIIEVE